MQLKQKHLRASFQSRFSYRCSSHPFLLRPAVSGEDEQELRADGAPASLREQIELLKNEALADVERHETELKQARAFAA